MKKAVPVRRGARNGAAARSSLAAIADDAQLNANHWQQPSSGWQGEGSAEDGECAMEAELYSQGGEIRSLMLLADDVRDALQVCGDAVRMALRNHAMEIDFLRRGPLSTLVRQDHAQIKGLIDRLLNDPLLDEQASGSVIQALEERLAAAKHARDETLAAQEPLTGHRSDKPAKRRTRRDS